MKRILLNMMNIIIITLIVFYLGNYLLLEDNFLHLSIASIINFSQRLNEKTHFLILGLLPIYVAAVVFGATVLGYYVVLKIQTLFEN
jgi:hypothetical protein